MNQITYNEKEEAYEIPFKIWGHDLTIRFYVEDQQEIIENFSEIGKVLDKVERNRERIADMLTKEKRFSGGYINPDGLAEHLAVDNAYFDIDENGTVMCFTVVSHDDYFFEKVGFEIADDGGIEITEVIN